MHAIEFLKAESFDAAVIALIGNDRALKGRCVKRVVETVLAAENEDDADLSLVKFAGKEADFVSVRDELRQVSMFGDRRVVLLEAADDFITRFRSELETYAAKPSMASVLILDAKSMPKTTRLAKAISKANGYVECQPLSARDLAGWLSRLAKEEHGKKLAAAVANLMAELCGTDLGLLEQELAKVAAYAGEAGTITEEHVRTLVGGWKAETTWVMIDAVRDGRMDQAFAALDRLLVAGEPVPKLLGGINFVFRKYAKAARLGANQPLGEALQQAGVFPRDVRPAAAYLQRIGPGVAKRIPALLLEADAATKGGSRTNERIEIERLLISLAGVTA